jgi:hypothetical protein
VASQDSKLPWPPVASRHFCCHCGSRVAIEPDDAQRADRDFLAFHDVRLGRHVRGEAAGRAKALACQRIGAVHVEKEGGRRLVARRQHERHRERDGDERHAGEGHGAPAGAQHKEELVDAHQKMLSRM